MRYLSVCSGIEAATVAWEPLGWEPVAFSEIEPFPCAVLDHHYPDVPNWGDMNNYEEWPHADVDLLCGGTPCQSFSIAGLREGLADPRGNLSLVYAAVARKYRPRWLVWENVAGVLSSDGGRDFASILGLLSGKRIEAPPTGWQSAGIVPGIESAYGLAWRVLDAQYVRVDGYAGAVPQRRRRVFLVGHLGDWRRAAAVLFEREGLSGNHPPGREAWQGAAGNTQGSIGGDGQPRVDVHRLVSFGEYVDDGVASNIQARDYKYATDLVSHTLRDEGVDASEDGTGRGTPLVVQGQGTNLHVDEHVSGTLGVNAGSAAGCAPMVFDPTQITSKQNRSNPQPGDPCHTLAKGMRAPVIAIQERATSENPGAGPSGKGFREDGASYTLEARTTPQSVLAFHGSQDPDMSGDVTHPVGRNQGQETCAMQGGTVRRLIPRECERLQGFPDDYTHIPWRGKPATDSPRYRALGNSWAVNAARWVGMRIQLVDELMQDSRVE